MAKKQKRKLVKGEDYDGWVQAWVDSAGKAHRGEYEKTKPSEPGWDFTGTYRVKWVRAKIVVVK